MTIDSSDDDDDDDGDSFYAIDSSSTYYQNTKMLLLIKQDALRYFRIQSNSNATEPPPVDPFKKYEFGSEF